MKTNSISFGQTYLMPSLRYMSVENRKKLKNLYPLGQIYPVDLYLGADKKGDLAVTITQTSPHDYLAVNNLVKFTPENIALLRLVKGMQNTYRMVHGFEQPVKKVTIPYLDYISKDELPYYVADEIEAYEISNFRRFYS